MYPDRNSLLIDAGGTGLHKDPAGIVGFGYFPDHPDFVLDRISQECGVIEVPPGPDGRADLSAFNVGSVLRLVPNHSCMTASGHRVYHVVDEHRVVVEKWVPCHGW